MPYGITTKLIIRSVWVNTFDIALTSKFDKLHNNKQIRAHVVDSRHNTLTQIDTHQTCSDINSIQKNVREQLQCILYCNAVKTVIKTVGLTFVSHTFPHITTSSSWDWLQPQNYWFWLYMKKKFYLQIFHLHYFFPLIFNIWFEILLLQPQECSKYTRLKICRFLSISVRFGNSLIWQYIP